MLAGAEPFSHDGSDVGVLLCHGFTGTPQSLRGWAGALAEAGFTVRLPLLPGHGTAWEDLARTSWTQWYAAVEDELADLASRCRVVVVAGLSMGGTLASLAAADHADVVDGLVLVNPAFRVDDPRMLALPVLRHLLPSLAGISDDRRLRDGEPELAYSRIPLAALHSQTRLWRHTVARLDRITCPVLLMTSAVDHVVPASSAALFAEHVTADVRRVELANSFHVATLDHDADLVTDETIAFVRSLAAQRAAS